MTLSLRLEKLLFIVDERKMAKLLADHAPDAATARMVARHVLVRASTMRTPWQSRFSKPSTRPRTFTPPRRFMPPSSTPIS